MFWYRVKSDITVIAIKYVIAKAGETRGSRTPPVEGNGGGLDSSMFTSVVQSSLIQSCKSKSTVQYHFLIKFILAKI